MKTNDTPPPADDPEANTAAGAGCMARLVRLVSTALASTHGTMMWDVIIDKDAIKIALQDEMERYSDDPLYAVEAVISDIMSRHGERMESCVGEEADKAKRAAINSLPNAEIEHPGKQQ
jgi:hypothetical protein